MQQVKVVRKLAPNKFVRIICSGKEFYAGDLVSRATSKVLHVIITDMEPQPQATVHNVDPPRRVVQEQPPADWDFWDTIDPGTVLVYIFGAILSVLWILLLFIPRMFDRTSVIILCMMTVAFLLPVALSFCPFPTFLTPQPAPRAGQPPYGAAGAAAPAAPGGYYSDGTYIPPRPGPPGARARHHTHGAQS